jgi:hypothetical protein
MHARALARSGPYRATTEPPLFAIITCIRSTPLQSLEGTSLMRTFLPSIESSITPLERVQWTVRLYLCADVSAMHAFEKRRYSPTKAHLKLLPALTECGRQAISAYLNATSTGSRPDGHVSCRAYQKLPMKPSSSNIGVSSSSAGTRGRGGAYHRCSRRKEIIGGLEMNIKDLQANAMAIEGFCREREPRANWTLGEQLGFGAPPRSTSTCTAECA